MVVTNTNAMNNASALNLTIRALDFYMSCRRRVLVWRDQLNWRFLQPRQFSCHNLFFQLK
jgi:hypothetical protein